MSWSVSRIGHARRVLELLAEDFGKITCSEPENTLKGKAHDQIKVALSSIEPYAPVRVDASGSQYVDSKFGTLNYLNVSIQPMGSFETNVVVSSEPAASEAGSTKAD